MITILMILGDWTFDFEKICPNNNRDYIFDLVGFHSFKKIDRQFASKNRHKMKQTHSQKHLQHQNEKNLNQTDLRKGMYAIFLMIPQNRLIRQDAASNDATIDDWISRDVRVLLTINCFREKSKVDGWNRPHTWEKKQHISLYKKFIPNLVTLKKSELFSVVFDTKKRPLN